MSTDPDTILLEAESAMAKGLDYLEHELRGIRSGRATPALVEYVKVECYGAQTDLKSLASISVPEPTQLLIKPFDPGTVNDIKKGLEASGIGLNPLVDGKQIRVNLPALSGDRRKQLISHTKKIGEDTKVVLRNARRDANKHADALSKSKDAHYPEDEVATLKDEIQELLKKHEGRVDELVASKTKEIEEI